MFYSRIWERDFVVLLGKRKLLVVDVVANVSGAFEVSGAQT